MKPENELRLARLASLDVRRGGAFALMLANRSARMTRGRSDLGDIVNRVYTHPTGRACYDCPECGQQYLASGEAADCCAFDPDDD